MNQRYLFSGVLMSVALSAVLLCNVSLADERRHHSAHVHGAGHGSLAQDDAALELKLELPGFNIVGFEHPPRNTEQQQAFDEAAGVLSSTEWLSISPGAECRLIQQQVTALGFGLDEGPAAESDHSHQHHSHSHQASDADENNEINPFAADHDHGAQKHDDHQHDSDKQQHHNHDHDHDHDHASFSLTLRWTCEQPDELSTLALDLFSDFPLNQTITLDLLTEARADQLILNSEQTEISLQ